MEQYSISGMSCAACQARVEKTVSRLEGVDSCSVSLLTNSMVVSGTASSETIIKAVTDAGYGASLKNSKSSDVKKSTVEDDFLKDTETPKILKRLIASLILLVPLMYVSMGHMMWGFPLPNILDNPLNIGLYELLLSAVIMVINQRFFVSGFKGIVHISPNMDTLVSLGSTASFVYSVYSLFAMSRAQYMGDMDLVHSYMNDLYFESAAMILTLITVGKLLESRAKGKTTDALKGLMKLAPKTATLFRDGKAFEVGIEQVKKGDLYEVKPGESIPVDGFVVEGASAVNESALTGESVPVDKKAGDQVYAATINQSGYIICEASRVGEDTTLSQIIQMVSDASATKAPIAKIADKVSGVFVPVVMSISFVTLIIWLIAGQDFSFALARAIAVLVISCPCALGLATPVAIMVGNGIGAKQGIMFKTASALEETGKAGIVALDKTGTITKGEPVVTDIIPASGVSSDELLSLALSLEIKSEHPLSKAVVSKAHSLGITSFEVEDFKINPGNGLSGSFNGNIVKGGNEEFVISSAYSDEVKKHVLELSKQGKTPLFFSINKEFKGIIAVADVIKEDSHEAINELKEMGIRVVMLTGDNSVTANAIGREVGVDEVFAGVKPDGKEEVIRSLQESGKVLMVGDGINDAPALTRADIGIAIGAGTDIAIDAADVVLMKNSLKDVAAGIRLSRKTLMNIKENLFWAFFYNVVGIPLAAGVWFPVFGWTLTPMFGAAAMSLSSFCVVMNALRLNMVKIYKDENLKEDTKMEITVKGMMCGHCEAHVKTALEKIDGVVEANANHDLNLVTITTSKEVNEEVIKAAVIDAGYEYEGIR